MESFHIITLLVATSALILLLTTVGILLHNDKRSQKFPPTHSKCPDGWTHAPDPTNPENLGTCTKGNVNTGDADDVLIYNLDADPCENKQWADSKKIYWDGLTTYNGC